jgi:AcrR family transcriptional regulator
MNDVTSLPGAQRSRDAGRTQKAILGAARLEFTEYGLGGARVDRIAQRADLNKSLIYYYFKDKENLFLSVLEDAYQNIREAETQLCLTELQPVEAIRRLAEFTWHYYIEHPEFLALINSENLHRAKHLRKSKRILEMNSPLLESLGNVLERGRKEGLFRGGVDPLQLYMSLSGMTYFYLSNHHTLSAVFGRNFMTPKALNERLSHVCDVLLGYLLRE